MKNEFDEEEQLFFKDLVLIYDICRFEAAWYPNNVSYWCSSFVDEDLKVHLNAISSP